MTGPDTPPASANDPARPLGLRERKKRETRAALHRAALELAAEVGPHGLTVDEIAARAGVSARTFFNYYAAKEAALLGVPTDLPQQLADALRARPRTEAPMESSRTVIRPYLAGIRPDTDVQQLRSRVFATYPELGVSFLRVAAELERAVASVTLERLTDSAEADPTPDQRMYAWLVGMATVGSARAALSARPGEPADPDRLMTDFDRAVDRVTQGLDMDVPHSPAH